MRVQLARRIAVVALPGVALAATLMSQGCSHSDPANLIPEEQGVSAPFVDDASAVEAEAGLINYCPSNKCPAGHTTCVDSTFACDVDLLTDFQNCGACGHVCPNTTRSEFYTCIEGQCVMTCASETGHADCDGLPDTGCETVLQNNNDNCGACGVKCDADNPCIDTHCGCPSGLTRCELLPGWNYCFPTQFDDTNCGGCGNMCDTSGPAPAPNMYPGCKDSKCGERKCSPGFADCNGDALDESSDGCETSIGTDTNCGACGDNCQAKGQSCLRKPADQGGAAYCGCPEGQTFCGTCGSPGTVTVHGDGGDVTIPLPSVCTGVCLDLTSDLGSCGTCGFVCPGANPRCDFGTCVDACPTGRADCDGNPDCEVNTMSDPHNCGGCGITCDAIEGQACVGGQCMVEPCDKDGGITR